MGVDFVLDKVTIPRVCGVTLMYSNSICSTVTIPTCAGRFNQVLQQNRILVLYFARERTLVHNSIIIAICLTTT